MHTAEETSAKDLATTAAAKDGDEVPTGHEAAEPSSRPRSPDELPPSYTPSPHTGRSHRDIPTSRRGPPCTCPRHHTAANPAQNPEGSEGPNWGKVIGGAAAVAVAAPVLVTAGAALVLPVIGFASSGVVGGSIAAGVQSVFYGGYTCGLFSALQYAGATIVAPSVVSTLTAAGAATVGGAAIRDGFQKSGEGEEGEDAHGAASGGQNAARVECSCAACECDESCDCACRGRGRRG